MQPVAGVPSGSSTHGPRSLSSRSKSPAGKSQVMRTRARYTCHSCSRRKVKCDKVHPVCGNCAKNGSECIYEAAPWKDENARRRARGAHKTKWQRQKQRTLEENTTGERMPVDSHLSQAGSSNNEKPNMHGIVSRMEKVISAIERLEGDRNRDLELPERQAAATDMESKSVDIAPMQKTNEQIQSSFSRSANPPPHAATDWHSDEFPTSLGEGTDLADSMESLDLGNLILEDDGKSRYIGTTSWAYISHEINELNQLLRNLNRSELPASKSGDPTNPVPRARRPWKGPNDSSTTSSTMSPGSPEYLQQAIIDPLGYSLPSKNAVDVDMLDHVPTRRQSQILYKSFMSSVHSLSPIIHPPIILKLYNSFWDWYDHDSYSGEPCPDPSFVPLLYAIWYGGSVAISIGTIKAEFNNSSRFALSAMYSGQVTTWLAKTSFPHSPSLQSLAAYLISQTILSREEEPLSSCLFISLAVSVAQTMGLHRDPAQFQIDPCEAEYRRRLWWHIVHMDCVIALSSGLPPLVSDENYWDVRETSEVKDTLLGTTEAIQYEKLLASGQRAPDIPDNPAVCDGSSMVNIYYLSGKGKCTMAQAVRKILKIQLGTKPLTKGDTEKLRSVLFELQSKLNSIIDRIPEWKDPVAPAASSGGSLPMTTELPGEGPFDCPEQYHSPVLVAFHKWARIILSLFIDKAFCVTYQPFLKNPRSRIWPIARQSALSHCYAFMEKFIRLATDPDFESFQWGWPGNHQPMHATMIMLIDIYKQPNSPEAPKSRAFIDQILALSGPDGGVVGGEDGVSRQRPLRDGGREAWNVIRRLRQKAWREAGLNPQLFWTEQDQIQAGVISRETDSRPLRYSNQNSLPEFDSATSSLKGSIPPVPVPGTLSSPPGIVPAFSTAAANSPVAPMIPMPDAQQTCPVSSTIPLIQAASPNLLSGPTLPSIANSNLNFDWDEWDAIFGPPLPISDELMEFDAVSEFEFADLGNTSLSGRQ